MNPDERLQLIIQKYNPKSEESTFKTEHKTRVQIAIEIEQLLGVEMDELIYLPRKGLLKLLKVLQEKQEKTRREFE